MRFFYSCVGWPYDDVHVEGGLCDLIEQRTTITRKTFMKQTDREDRIEIETSLGYGPDFRITQDWHVEYFRSMHHGERVYGLRHSAIEYVFKRADQ